MVTTANPNRLSAKQLFYILGPQCLGAATISGMANFGVACAMYRTTTDKILFWPLKNNTIAGDLAVTIFIQGIITFIAVSALVHNDLRLGRIAPFPRAWPSTEYGFATFDLDQATTKIGRFFRWFHNEHGLARGLHFFSGSDAQDLLDFKRVDGKTMLGRWILSVWKGSVLSALFWFIYWPISVAILAPLWGGKNMTGTWIPPLIKLVYGFLYALVQNPLVACIALGSEDSIREHLHDEEVKRWQDHSGPTNTANEKVHDDLNDHSHPTSPPQTARASLDFQRSPRASLDRYRINTHLPTAQGSASPISPHRYSLEVPSAAHLGRGRPALSRSQSDQGSQSFLRTSSLDRTRSNQASGSSSPRVPSAGADIDRRSSIDVATLRRSLDISRSTPRTLPIQEV